MGIVPRETKIAKVMPIHKSADPFILENNRPACPLPVFPNYLNELRMKN